MKKLVSIVSLFILITSCSTMKEVKTTGSIDRIDPSLNDIINKDAVIEILAEGYQWSEGPVWIDTHKMLLFSDVKADTIYKWTEEKGAEVYLTPSGYTDSTPSQRDEPGSNGLTLSNDGKLILCQHGDRRVAMLDAPFDAPQPRYVTIADKYDNKKFNSPNDVVSRRNGDLFFTDPPYGLPQKEKDPTREIPFQGVYKIAKDGKVALLVDSLTRPNGLAFTPDEKKLIVANSDPDKAVWYVFDVSQNDSLSNARVLYDVTENAKTEKGLPDGLKIDKQGNIFATGPGGLWVFNAGGKLIGRIRLPEPTANCTFADDEKTLYITSNMTLLRLKMR
jgi:gluconolactonase